MSCLANPDTSTFSSFSAWETSTGRLAQNFVSVALSSSLLAVPISTFSPVYASPSAEFHEAAKAADGAQVEHDSTRLATVQSIRRLARYEDGWAGEESKAPTSKSLEDAEAFIWNLNLEKSYEPFVSISKDGELNFWWNQNGVWIDLGMFGDGTYSYYAKLADGKEYINDGINICQTLPSAILEAIRI